MGDDAARPSKRARTAPSTAPTDSVLALDSLDVAALKASFAGAQPFPHCAIDGLVMPEVLPGLEQRVMQRDFVVKENDLFSFLQSADLASDPSIASSSTSEGTDDALASVVRALYSSQFRSILAEITGCEGLSDKLDLTSSVYAFTNNLLCHDDELSTRRVAYILYLVPEDWSAADGGSLDLFTVDASKQPNGIAHRIMPKRNSLVFFEVSDRSYHQVAEVLARDKARLTIGGWFHGPKASAPANWKPCAPSTGAVQMPSAVDFAAPQPLPAGAKRLADWVEPTYMKEETQAAVRERFEEDSVIQLHDFFREERLGELRQWLVEAQWEPTGPYHKQRVDLLAASEVRKSSGAAVLLELFRSAEMAMLLAQCTGVEVEAVRAALRRFEPGCYTLAYDLRDEAAEAPGGELDLCWTLVEDNDAWAAGGDDDEEEEDDEEKNSKGKSKESGEGAARKVGTGGQMVYAVDGEEDPLLVVHPRANMLTMVFRAEPGTQSFVKYVNSTAPSPRYDVVMTCKVKVEDDDEEEEEDE